MAISFFVRCYVAVIGRDDEHADLANPQGNIYGFSACVVAENSKGARWAHNHQFTDRSEDVAVDKARKLLQKIEAAYCKGIKLDRNKWYVTSPMFGDSPEQLRDMTPEERAE